MPRRRAYAERGKPPARGDLYFYHGLLCTLAGLPGVRSTGPPYLQVSGFAFASLEPADRICAPWHIEHA
jgi:hypothetical protein